MHGKDPFSRSETQVMTRGLMELVSKYDVSGPRYTSYPPAPVFSNQFGAAEMKEAVLRTEEDPAGDGISLYLHIPFCDTLCYFCGCTTIITRNQSHLAEYLQYLKKEIDILAPLINKRRRMVQMHWGGGTPTYLSPSQIEELGAYLRKSFRFDEHAEVSVEIDPRDLTYHHLRALRQSGFNRISLGVQDFNSKVQHAINRNQSEFLTREVITWSRDLGFTSTNVDLIYGLPLQTPASFRETLEKIIDISPERIAVYNFAFVPWLKKAQKLISRDDLPSPEAKIEILATTIDRLMEAGYEYIGMDHFAKPTDELAVAQKTKSLLRNFQGYSTKAGADLYGLGMSSISHFGPYYAQNEKTLPEYYAAIDKGTFATHLGYHMTFDDEVRKFVIMRLMCDLELRFSDVADKFKINVPVYFAESLVSLRPLVTDGFIVATDSSLTVTSLGRRFLRNIAMCFDAHLPQAAGKTPLYSKTV
jgi:oxygen-independent coproporphyrinogen-3 oxidase